MQLLIQLIIFSVSILVLAKSSHWVIDSSVKIAKFTRLSQIVIGFILLSVATTIPELAVSIYAIISEDIGISIGNLLGSNVTNICLILGIVAMIKPFIMGERALKNLSIILLLSSLIPVLLLNVTVVTVASRFIGIILVLAFILFCLYSVKERIIIEKIVFREPTKLFQRLIIPFKFYKSILILFLGLAGVIISARFVVDSASSVAEIVGIPESVIGATLMAFGTSIPEFFLALTAVKKGHIGLALGDTIGACLTRLTLVLGIVLVFSQFVINMTIFTTLISFVIASTILLWFFLGSFGRRKLDKGEGTVLLFIYITFIITTFSIQILI